MKGQEEGSRMLGVSLVNITSNGINCQTKSMVTISIEDVFKYTLSANSIPIFYFVNHLKINQIQPSSY